MNKEKSLIRQNYWESHVAAFHKSGFTQREYCRQQNISYWSFNSRKRSLGKLENTELQEISTETIQQLKPENNKNIDIVLNNNIRISIPIEFSESSLQKILSVLKVLNEN